MNRKMVFYTTGQLVLLEAALFLLPVLVSLIYGERCVTSFLISSGIAAVIGVLMMAVTHPKNRVIYAKEGFLITTLSWIILSAVGALPFYLSGEIPLYVDAFFESVSGFTTTGASILPNVETLSRGLLFWRSLTHWIGGMGVLVLMMAIVPPSEGDSGRSIHIMRAEMAGPVIGKLVPRVRETAKILYLIYIFLTLLTFILLYIGGMPLFDSVLHAFATAGTGGFGIKADSVAGYSPYLQWVITIFMVLCGINFNIYYLLLVRNFRSVLRSTEMWYYFAIIFVSTAIITLNLYPMIGSVGESFRHAAFQVASIITTTGYATMDFDLWPQLSKGVLFLLMIVGACAGSTGGGMKVSRVVILVRSARQSLARMLHPRSVCTVHFEGKPVQRSTLEGLSTYVTLYFLLIFFGFLILCLEPFGFEANLSAIVSCFNNIGPGFDAVGPAMSYADYSAVSKLVLSAAMLLGRLEIIPILIAASPSTWLKK